jgi:acyl carrier protein
MGILIKVNRETMQQILNSIQKLLKQKLNIEDPVLTPKTDFQKDLNLVEWEKLYLLNAVERKWHVSINQNDLEQIGNIEQLVAVVRSKGASR